MGIFRVGFLLISVALRCFATDLVQSEFRGPVDLRVWKHMQDSWNVEEVPGSSPEFILRRGKEVGQKKTVGFLELQYTAVAEAGLRVRFSGTAYKRFGPRGTKLEAVSVLEASSFVVGGASVFRIEAPEYVDEPGTRIVTEIEFEILRGSDCIYHYSVLPMYVRGSQNQYWQEVIDPYRAHAGKGVIEVASTSSSETNLDYWNGQRVQPSLSSIELFTVGRGSMIGLHRHVSNQEMWLINEGQFMVSHGMAKRVSDIQQVVRKWDSTGKIQSVDEFSAKSLYIEQRKLSSKEYVVIVPDPKETSSFCLHGLVALSEGSFFSMGTKN